MRNSFLKTFTSLVGTYFLFQSIILADEIPIGPNGKPNLNGVWQVMNRANFNLEAHSASAAMQLVEGPVVTSTSSRHSSFRVSRLSPGRVERRCGR